MENQKTVLVTGGSGFIATHCIIKLTAAGFKVRSTVRDLSRTNKLNQIISDGLRSPPPPFLDTQSQRRCLICVGIS